MNVVVSCMTIVERYVGGSRRHQVSVMKSRSHPIESRYFVNRLCRATKSVVGSCRATTVTCRNFWKITGANCKHGLKSVLSLSIFQEDDG